MPLVTPQNELIVINLTDRVFQNTTIKQKATFSGLEHRQNSDGVSSALIMVLVQYFADSDGDYGVHLHDKGVPDVTKYLVADNDTVVDASTGAILAIKTDGNRDEWESIVNGYEQNVMLQGDFFGYLRDNASIIIGDMIRQHIAQGDAMGKFA